MNNIAFSERTWQVLEDTPFTGQDADEKVRHLLKGECLRRLARYRHADLVLTRKYGMTFDEFVRRRITREKGYTWESESDAMNWETAISGMKDTEHHLGKLRDDSHVRHSGHAF